MFDKAGHKAFNKASVIEPHLFFIHISDVDENLTYARTASFLDDARLILMLIKSYEGQNRFQEDLNKVYGCAEMNKMYFNEEKLVHLRHSHPRINLSGIYQGLSLYERLGCKIHERRNIQNADK